MRKLSLLAMVTLIVASWWINHSTVALSASPEEPGGTPADAVTASQHPDEYAWQLFLFINRQAKAGVAGIADDTKATIRDYDDDKPVVWETWGLSSGLVLDSNNNVMSGICTSRKTRSGDNFQNLFDGRGTVVTLSYDFDILKPALKSCVLYHERAFRRLFFSPPMNITRFEPLKYMRPSGRDRSPTMISRSRWRNGSCNSCSTSHPPG